MVEEREEARQRERERNEGETDDEMRELQITWAKQLSYSSPQPVRKATERDSIEREGRKRVMKRVTQPVVLIWSGHTLLHEV